MCFVGGFIESTGEVINKPYIFDNRGLKFKIVQKNNGSILCEITGSLHKFYNGGKNNANEFTRNQVIKAFQELNNLYNIPLSSEVINFEFGVNIELPKRIKVQDYIKGIILQRTKGKHLKAYHRAKTTELKYGKVAAQDNYLVKAYDKGKQCKLKTAYLFRTEIKILRKRFLEKHQIKEKNKPLIIKDLIKKETFNTLASLLIEEYESMVHVNKKCISWKILTDTERKKYLQYINVDYWEDLTHKTKYRQVERFTKILKMYSNNDMHNIVISLLKSKLRNVLNNQENEKAEVKNVAFTPNNVNGANLDKGLFKKEKNKTPPKKCAVCGADISAKKNTAKYCSKKCSNKITNLKRKEKKHIYILTEKETLRQLERLIINGEVLKCKYLINNKSRRIGIYTNEFYKTDFPYSKRRKIIKVEVSFNGGVLILTKMRAKEFVKIAISHNRHKRKYLSSLEYNQFDNNRITNISNKNYERNSITMLTSTYKE